MHREGIFVRKRDGPKTEQKQIVRRDSDVICEADCMKMYCPGRQSSCISGPQQLIDIPRLSSNDCPDRRRKEYKLKRTSSEKARTEPEKMKEAGFGESSDMHAHHLQVCAQVLDASSGMQSLGLKARLPRHYR